MLGSRLGPRRHPLVWLSWLVQLMTHAPVVMQVASCLWLPTASGVLISATSLSELEDCSKLES